MIGVATESWSSANRPGILIIGSPDVGKRTLTSRLLSVDFGDAIEYSSERFVHRGWTIETKYYSADVSVFMAHLGDDFSINTIPRHDQLAALVLVFDIKHVESFTALQNWVCGIDIEKYDILLCVANKMDLVPDHVAHTEYKRKILKQMSSLDTPSESTEFGILEAEGRSLLGDEEPLEDLRMSCFEWCLEHNIEYIEACGSNIEFDKCLSVSGDSQGVERVFGALSAHMWPGMILKSHNEIIKQPFLQQDSSETEDSDYEVGYEVLSAEPWDDFDDDDDNDVGLEPSSNSYCTTTAEHDDGFDSTGVCASEENAVDIGATMSYENGIIRFGSEGLEGLMAEIGNMRENLRLMPDFQRRQMAADLAMRVATMLGDDCGDEDAGALAH